MHVAFYFAVPVVAYAAASLSLIAQTHADTSDAQFVRLLANQGIYSTDGPAGVIAVAHEICADLASGFTPQVEANRLYNVSIIGMSTYQAGYMVGASIGAYCPQYGSMLNAKPGWVT